MFSRAFSTRRNAATAWTCVASSRIPMPPESMLARNVPEGEFAKAVLLKKPTASSIVASALSAPGRWRSNGRITTPDILTSPPSQRSVPPLVE